MLLDLVPPLLRATLSVEWAEIAIDSAYRPFTACTIWIHHRFVHDCTFIAPTATIEHFLLHSTFTATIRNFLLHSSIHCYHSVFPTIYTPAFCTPAFTAAIEHFLLDSSIHCYHLEFPILYAPAFTATIWNSLLRSSIHCYNLEFSTTLQHSLLLFGIPLYTPAFTGTIRNSLLHSIIISHFTPAFTVTIELSLYYSPAFTLPAFSNFYYGLQHGYYPSAFPPTFILHFPFPTTVHSLLSFSIHKYPSATIRISSHY